MITNGSIANVPYIGVLPTTVTNFGGRTQVCTTENPYTPTMSVFGGGQNFQSVGTGALAQPNPYAIVNQAQGMIADVFNKMASGNIDSALSAAITQKNQLIAKYNSGTASNEMKSVIQEQVKQLENYERQLNYLKANAGNLDPQTAYQRSEYIKHGVTNLITLSTTTIKAMETTSAQSAQSVQETPGTEGEKPEDTQEAKAEKVKEDNIYTRAGEEDLDKEAVNTQYYDQLIEDLHDAMFCWGTKDSKFEEALDKINKENVIELMYIWNQKYPNESFMEAFMADAGPIQKKEYGVKISTALEQAAADLGIDLSKDEDMLAIKKEMNSWFWIDNSVADNYNNVVKKLLTTAGVEYDYSPYSIWSK